MIEEVAEENTSAETPEIKEPKEIPNEEIEEEIKEILFEGYMFKAPNNVDAYLTDLYNNYMQLPPEDKRKVHSIFFANKLVKR